MRSTPYHHYALYEPDAAPDLTETGEYNSAIMGIDADLHAEETERKAADESLGRDIEQESQVRESEDAKLSAAIAAERSERTSADTALGGRIDNAETEISANSADLTGIKGLTYGSGHVQFIENENGSYSSPALEEIAEQVTALETAGWSDIRGKPFSTIGSGLKVVSDALTVDASAISAGITGNTTWGEIEQP